MADLTDLFTNAAKVVESATGEAEKFGKVAEAVNQPAVQDALEAVAGKDQPAGLSKAQRTIRTVIQVVLGVAAFVAVFAAGLPVSGSLAVLVAACTAVTALMQSEAVNAVLVRFAPWLAA